MAPKHSLLFFISITIFLSTSIATATTSTSLILSALGFDDLSSAAINTSVTIPTTIFAPTDSSIATCPSCSLSLLLQEYSIPGLYPLQFLRTLAFGTKIESLSPNRCLTVTSTSSSKKAFINGAEISKPDIFNNGILIIHSLRGFVSHVSPLSCEIQTMTSLTFPQQPSMSVSLIMRPTLKDAMMKLRQSGFSLLALAMRVKYPELSDLKSMTLFAIDDESFFFQGGDAYMADLGFHVVPNMVLKEADLISLPRGTVFPTMERGRGLVVTTAGAGGPLRPMRINYVKVKSFDMVSNSRIVVHVLSMPFRQMD